MDKVKIAGCLMAIAKELLKSASSNSDLMDALDHMSDFMESWEGGSTLDPKDFDVSKVTSIRIRDIPDDLSSWADWDEGELLEMDEEERSDEIAGFRGDAWGKRAESWTFETMPPIVIGVTPFFEGVADGRGRVTYALGMGWDSVPAVFLTSKKSK